MFNKKHIDRLIDKMSNLENVYKEFMVEYRQSVEFGIYNTVNDRQYSPPNKKDYRPIKIGDKWGKEYGYSWFGGKVIKPTSGKKFYLESQSGAIESLIFIDGKPLGMFDNYGTHFNRLHKYFALDFIGSELFIDIEGYASHKLPGMHPLEKDKVFVDDGQDTERVYNGFFVVTFNEDIVLFVDQLHIINKMYLALDENDLFKADLVNLYQELNVAIDCLPQEGINIEAVKKANRILAKIFGLQKSYNSDYQVGIIGHSHLDTAWLWTVQESKRKAARTLSNAVAMLKKHSDYKFIFSSVLHLEWIKDYYPQLFNEIKTLTTQKKFEPNGAVYVECDCNLTGAEALARQFIVGQRWLQSELRYTADTLWLPDSFGYCAALPQIMKGVDVKNFLTTKLSWNDTNKFLYDTFMWEGLDGSKVKVHFNTINTWVDPKTVVDRVEDLPNKHITKKALIAYGYGDGGGGPSTKMVEYAMLTCNLTSIPKVKHTTVSEFMAGFDSLTLPTYYGELYFEMHRGTYTSISRIKKINRQLENALHHAEYFSARARSSGKSNELDSLYKVLMQNQFHDILPGTSIQIVNELAIAQNIEAINQANSVTTLLINSSFSTIPTSNRTTNVSTQTLSFNKSVDLPKVGMSLLESEEFLKTQSIIQSAQNELWKSDQQHKSSNAAIDMSVFDNSDNDEFALPEIEYPKTGFFDIEVHENEEHNFNNSIQVPITPIATNLDNKNSDNKTNNAKNTNVAIKYVDIKPTFDELSKTIALINTYNIPFFGHIKIAGRYQDKNAVVYRDFDDAVHTSLYADIAPYSVQQLDKLTNPPSTKTVFRYMEKMLLETPKLKIRFDGQMCIIGMFDKDTKREIVAQGGKLNELMLYRDVPREWDNWDIDIDYVVKKRECKLVSTTKILDSDIEFRLRNVYSVGDNSTLIQDLIVNSTSMDIIYENKLTWKEKHYLLKTRFDTSIFANTMRSDTPWGYVARPTTQNTTIEQGMYEVCNHKWSDISEPNYGVSIFNNCKYGISCNRGSMALSLMKSGTHPDASGDCGEHYFDYCISAHNKGFDFDVILKGYNFDKQPFVTNGEVKITPILHISNQEIIVETIKQSYDRKDIIIRAYESMGNRSVVNVSLDKVYDIAINNLLESEIKKIGKFDKFELEFKPFEIITIRLAN